MIGRQLVSLLKNENAEIHVADLNKPVNMPDDIIFHNVDLKNFDNCKNICKGIDYVFNLVGIKCSPQVCIERPAEIMGPMMQFNTNMLEAAMLSNVEWYSYTSTVGVYEPAKFYLKMMYGILSLQKMIGMVDGLKEWENFSAKAYEKQFGKGICSIIRPANVYGPYDNFDPENATVIPSLIRKANDNEILEVWGDGSPIRDFIHCRDVALGMMHLVKNKVTEPVNLGSGSGISIKQIADIISKRFGREIKWLSDKPMGDKRRVFDTKRAEKYGFKTQISLEFGINETIDWFIENKEIIDERYNVFR